MVRVLKFGKWALPSREVGAKFDKTHSTKYSMQIFFVECRAAVERGILHETHTALQTVGGEPSAANFALSVI